MNVPERGYNVLTPTDYAGNLAQTLVNDLNRSSRQGSVVSLHNGPMIERGFTQASDSTGLRITVAVTAVGRYT